MLRIDPSWCSSRRPLRGANAQTVPEYSSVGPEERAPPSTLRKSVKVQMQVEAKTT